MNCYAPGIALALLLSFVFPATAQWTAFTPSNSPFSPHSPVPHVAADPESGQVYVIASDTSLQLHAWNAQNGWTSYPQYDQLLDTINIYDTKARNGKLWALTARGLLSIHAGGMQLVRFPDTYMAGTNGLVVLADESVWFPGGPQGRGITQYHPQAGWKTINSTTHPELTQDLGITDLKLDERDSVLWIGANCFSAASGVFSYQVKTGRMQRYDNGNPRYGCIHAVEPAAGKTFVGTANFSSLRILDASGTYTQSLDQPRIKWISELRTDPADSNRVWALTSHELVLFTDTSRYVVFDSANSPLRGAVHELSAFTSPPDSAQVWVGTTTGLFRYAYRKQQPTGTSEKAAAPAFGIYPNPASRQVTLRYTSAFTGSVSVLDASGSTVLSLHADGLREQPVDTGSLLPGVYTVVLRDARGLYAQKLVLTR